MATVKLMSMKHLTRKQWKVRGVVASAKVHAHQGMSDLFQLFLGLGSIRIALPVQEPFFAEKNGGLLFSSPSERFGW